MAAELRKSGISVVGDIPWGTHFCYFYETKQDLLDILVPYFKAGFESEEFCLWIISNSELITLREAKEALGQTVADLDRYLAEGRMEIVSHDEWFLRDGVFDLHKVVHRFKEKLDEAVSRGYAGLRLNGSPAWLESKDPKELREFEGEIDHLFANEHVIASCTYPLAESRAEFLLDVARNHQFAIAKRQGQWDLLETPELMQAKQEIQRLNEELERRVIERTGELAAANEELRTEIGERHRAEEKLRGSEDRIRLIIDTIPVMAWSVRPDGIVDFLNQRWMDYSGLTLEQYVEEPMGPIHPEDIQGVVEKWRADLTLGKPYEHEMRLRGADGEYRWFLIRSAPLRDESGKIIKWYGVSTDIDDRKRAEEQLKVTSEELRALSSRLSSAREEEGTRIARELHDELGSVLTSLKWELEDMLKRCSESANQTDYSTLGAKLEEIMGMVDDILSIVRRISSELRPSILDDIGLMAAIEWQAKQFESRSGIACTIDLLVDDLKLNPDQSTGIFRILQETLTNILRHAQASRVNVLVEEVDGALVLEVRDNGRGITGEEITESSSLGLIGMRERAHLLGGSVEIAGTAGRGTVLILRVPIHHGDQS